MDLKLNEQSNEKVVFVLKEVTAAYANTLRRLVINDVPTMAIEDVTFLKNDSVLYDEIIAHRLGLVVLKTDLESYNMMSVCSCKGAGCAQCQLKLTIDVEGPRTVYAEDIISSDPAVVPVFPKTVITKLIEGQNLKCEATAILGTGKEHVKWGSGLVWYNHEPVIKVNNKSDNFAAVKNKFPPQIFNEKGEIEAAKINSPQLIDACADVDEDVVSITFVKDSFTITVEAFGSLSPKKMLTQAIDVFDKQLDGFAKLVKTI